MNYAEIKNFDLNNGDGIRVSLWVTGCPIQCEGCHNKHLWNREVGKCFTQNEENYIIDLLKQYQEINLSILGGEPLAPYNYDTVLKLCKRVKEELPDKNIWLWTGYSYSCVQDLEIMKYLDVLIEGKYIKTLREEDPEIWWRGSKNQNMIRLGGE